MTMSKAQQLIDAIVSGEDVTETIGILGEDSKEWVTSQLKAYKDRLKRYPKDKRTRQLYASLAKTARDMGLQV